MHHSTLTAGSIMKSFHIILLISVIIFGSSLAMHLEWAKNNFSCVSRLYIKDVTAYGDPYELQIFLILKIKNEDRGTLSYTGTVFTKQELHTINRKLKFLLNNENGNNRYRITNRNLIIMNDDNLPTSLSSVIHPNMLGFISITKNKDNSYIIKELTDISMVCTQGV